MQWELKEARLVPKEGISSFMRGLRDCSLPQHSSVTAQLTLNLGAGEEDLEALLCPQRGWGNKGTGMSKRTQSC